MMCTLCIKHNKDECLLRGLIMSHMQYFITYINAYTFIKIIYINIMHTFETKKHAITLFGGRITLGPFLFWGPRFFKPMGSKDPVFFLIPSTNIVHIF